MNATEIEILLVDHAKRRERLMARRAALWNSAEELRAKCADPGHPSWDRRAMRNEEISARMACQRIDHEVWVLDSEVAKLKREGQDEHAAMFNRVRQVVATTNVVALPFHVDSPEAA